MAASISTVGWENCSEVIWRVSWGFVGRGDLICEGERERPLAMWSELGRREWRFDARESFGSEAEGVVVVADDLAAAGISRTLSLRRVVCSVTDSRAGS